jgi:predicted transcriptional regulator
VVSGVITVRLEDEIRKKIAKLMRERAETKSDLIRKALLEFVAKETEMDEIKQVVARKFAEGKISFDELVRVLGYDEAKKVAFFVDIAEKSFQEGI